MVVVGLSAWVAINFDSPRDAVLYLKGARLVVEPAVVSVGEGRPGEQREATFTVRNLASRPVEILGCKTSCSCVSTETFPVFLAPGQLRELRLKLTLDGRPGDVIDQVVMHITNSEVHPKFAVRLVGRVSDAGNTDR